MIDFGLVDAMDAEALGEPGARTFRLRARAGQNLGALWMEKEQLTQLGQAISRLLADRATQRGRFRPERAAMGDFQFPDVDMQIVRLGIDYDNDTQRVILVADDQEALQRGDTPAFRVEISHAQALGLAQQISEVVSAGRPLCPLCGHPLEGDGQHFCPGSNGHSKELPIPGTRDGDDIS